MIPTKYEMSDNIAPAADIRIGLNVRAAAKAYAWEVDTKENLDKPRLLALYFVRGQTSYPVESRVRVDITAQQAEELILSLQEALKAKPRIPKCKECGHDMEPQQ